TIAAKGDNTPDQPHRRSYILWEPDRVAIVPRACLEQLAAVATASQQPHGQQHRDSQQSSSFDLQRFIADHLLVRRDAPWGDGHKWIIACPWNRDHDDGAAYLLRLGNGAIAAGCHHNSCAGKDWHALRELYEPKADRQHAAGTPPRAGINSFSF